MGSVCLRYVLLVGEVDLCHSCGCKVQIDCWQFANFPPRKQETNQILSKHCTLHVPAECINTCSCAWFEYRGQAGWPSQDMFLAADVSFVTQNPLILTGIHSAKAMERVQQALQGLKKDSFMGQVQNNFILPFIFILLHFTLHPSTTQWDWAKYSEFPYLAGPSKSCKF